ncbi:PAS/PAC sensor signal transduction histidine kinase [Bacillus oleivorans]|uniref:histidine kinase n=1 Tax=Bacillus oleivorans TaxID=1448271 RepID=A0A285D3L7_9BACI|nr:PAS domain S-box protein [Bacillus oleivorans]SNX74421.1 PAS/PAC sensor signal transduction histidine kinase [Bacillus oleivorans]
MSKVDSTKDLIKQINGYHAFINRSGELISHFSRSGISTYISPASLTLLGYESKELIGKSIFDFCHPQDQYLLEQIFSPFLQSDTEKKRTTFRIRRKEGNYIWVESTFIIIDSEELFCISRDVTEQKVIEEELKANQDKYQLLVDNLLDTVGIITLNGIWIYINEAGKRLFGTIRSEEIIGKSFIDLFPEKERNRIQECMERSLLNLSASLNEVTILRQDHQTKQVELKFIPTIYKEKKTYQVIIRDITERKKIEEKLQQTEKLSVVGQLAAGIAHEIRNPLTAIKGFTQLVKENYTDEYLSVVLTELEQIETIINDLLILAKPQVEIIQKVDIRDIIESSITLFHSQAILSNCEFIVNINFKNQYVVGESEQLKQVFINLIKNSTEAMPNGGNILINADIVEDMIKILITDEGVGIPKDRILKLGEPFYSTKEKGTGLGLMICNRIIKNHSGSLHIDSKVNEGTTVTIQLPRVP